MWRANSYETPLFWYLVLLLPNPFNAALLLMWRCDKGDQCLPDVLED